MAVDVKHGWMDVYLKNKTKMEGEMRVSTKIVQGPAGTVFNLMVLTMMTMMWSWIERRT